MDNKTKTLCHLEALNMSPGKARCYIDDGKIKADSFWGFSTDILDEIVKEGYSGEDLILEFKRRKDKVKQGFAQMVADGVEDIRTGKGKSANQVFEEISELRIETCV